MAFKPFIVFIFCQHMPNNFCQFFAHDSPGDVFSASTFYFIIEFFHRSVLTVRTDRGLAKGHSKVPIAILVARFMTPTARTVFTARNQPAITDELLVGCKTQYIPHFRQDRPSGYQSDTGNRKQALQLAGKVRLLFYGVLHPPDMLLE